MISQPQSPCYPIDEVATSSSCGLCISLC